MALKTASSPSDVALEDGVTLRAEVPPVAATAESPSLRGAQRTYPSLRFATAGLVRRKGIYGFNGDLTESTFSPEYHSIPHIHDCEQMTYVVDGEMFMFIQRRGFHLRAGEFIRVPRNAVHWAWNRSSRPCKVISSHTPMLAPDPADPPYLFGAFQEQERPLPDIPKRWSVPSDVAIAPEVEERLDHFERDDETWTPFRSSLRLRLNDYKAVPLTQSAVQEWRDGSLARALANYPEAKFSMAGGVESRAVRGDQGSLGYFTRYPGYHSPPHAHQEGEQMNYGVKGKTVWIFVAEKGYALGPGDLNRVPPGQLHWARNPGAEVGDWVETHVPSPFVVPGLYARGEIANPVVYPATAEWHVDAGYAVEVEQRLFGKD